MEEKIIGVKELRVNLEKIARAAKRGQRFLVMRRHEPLFRIQPFGHEARKKYTLTDLRDIQFSDPAGDRDLSKQIDHIAYGL
ncbi:MAG: hypothetical protein A3C90_02125 [Candidatus Magasanikbacteria bacterium RIFCSPHIGHO2_02_FULL_51_14]|uniref:Antitoxin n=1 Tax=Candidatus Magasanikbacteria bacterium RIFCSPHIGHO2_02_FULL_51_14 TaxID=1798683 RepID=A0A1F6MQN5_9BACT|nr:MAG: hypothetical protein A3C90_02125 [Candidatus Magasanikbacteria bacterium RIFCSPHIGHO2_02_FULL_51_14]